MASSRAAVREDLKNYWPQRARALEYGREDFRFTLIRNARRLPRVSLDRMITHANWQRDNGQVTAEINFTAPDDAAGLIAPGDEVLCEVAAAGRASAAWQPRWRLKVDEPSHGLEDHMVSVALSGTRSALTRGKLAWKFRSDRAHPAGWTATQITRQVCERLGVQIAALPASSHRIAKLVDGDALGVDIIVRAWKAEREATGRQFDLDLSTGQLRLTELRVPEYMVVLRDDIISGTIQQSIREMATTAIATATVRPRGSKKARKLRVTVSDPELVLEYGHIPRTFNAPRSAGISSEAELRRWARRQLEQSHTPSQAIDLTLPGMAFADRGDATRVVIPRFGIDRVAYFSAVRHDLSAGSYTMQVTVDFTDDPYADARKERADKARERAKAKRSGAAVTAPSRKKSNRQTSRENG